VTYELCSTARQKKPVSVHFDLLKDKQADLTDIIDRVRETAGTGVCNLKLLTTVFLMACITFEQGFGGNGLGVITVSGVPGLLKAKRNLLPLSYVFAHKPEEIRNKFVHEDSYYSIGWSHGKENIQGQPDFKKVRRGLFSPLSPPLWLRQQ